LIHGGQSIQVKTTDKGKRPEWLVGRRLDVSPHRYFALVDYRDSLAPVVYLVPSQSLEDAVSEADLRYYEQRPQSKPFEGRTISDPWNHDVPKYSLAGSSRTARPGDSSTNEREERMFSSNRQELRGRSQVPGEIIFDPTCGSSTTGVATLMAG
jgi:hypothetical protein